jgi:hypothetical protein
MVFMRLFPEKKYKYNQVDYLYLEDIELNMPRTGFAYRDKPSPYGLLYSRIRPHRHDSPDGPCYKSLPESVFVPYANIKDVVDGHKIASEMNDELGGCYNISVMRRIRRQDAESAEIENWLVQDRGDHSKIGGYLDWLAQNWEEI